MAVVPKAKRRNSEKRKEHSRDAARHRRSREAEVFLDLAKDVPLPYDLVKLLDKTSIIRLTITYLKLRTLLAEGVTGNELSINGGHLEWKLDQLCHRVHDGFLMIVASDGDVLFVTDNITSFLGLTQVDMMGQSIYDLSHPCDHDEIREVIGVKSHPSTDDSRHCRDIFIRMKSTITSKGRNVHVKSASYKVISCSSHVKSLQTSLRGGGEGEETISFVVIVGQSVTHPLNMEVPLDSQTFVSRHGLDMKFSECDESVYKLLGYHPDEIIGKSMYSYHHALDTESLDRTFKTLFCKGQATTGLYRFLAQRGGFVWVETHATVINNAVTDKPDHVVCLNYVVSGVECRDMIFDTVQLCPKMAPPDNVNKMEYDEDEKADEAGVVLRICPDTYKGDEQDSDQMCMQFVTEKILEQAAKDRDDSDLAAIDHMDRYLLDPSSELASSDQSLYSINKLDRKSHDGKISSMAGHDHGMLKNLSNTSLSSLLDKMEDGMEMRAPYISMDDLVFSSVDTPLVQSYVTEPQLSGYSLMNSEDLLLPSVGGELSDPISSLFAMSLSESQATRSNVPLTRKSAGTKRLHSGADDVDLIALPCKVPRLDSTESAFGTDRSGTSRRPSASVSTVTMLTGPLTHVPPLTASQGSFLKQGLLGGAKSEQQGKFFPIANLIGAPEKKLPSTGEVGSGGQQMEGSTTVYLVLNGQLTPVTIRTDQQMIAVKCGDVEVQSEAQKIGGSTVIRTAQGTNLCPINHDVQLEVSSGGDTLGTGDFVLDLTDPGNCTVKMVSGEDFLAPRAESANRVASGSTFLESNEQHKTLLCGFGKNQVGHQLSANQTMTSLGGQELGISESIGAFPGQQLRAAEAPPSVALPRLTSNQLVGLVAPSARKVQRVMPNLKQAERPAPQVGTVAQERYYFGSGTAQDTYQHVVGGTRGAVEFASLGTDVIGSREGLPLHLKVRSGCMQAVHPDFPKVFESGNLSEGPAKLDKLASDLSKPVLNGGSVQPLRLLQEGVAVAQYPPGSPSEGSGSGQKQFFIPQGSASAVLNVSGQQLPKPRAQMIIKSIRQPATSALRGIGQQVAARHTDGSDALVRQGGDAPEAGYAEHLATPCSGAVLDASGGSVLMNLLMKGVDVNYGYRLQSRTVLDSQKRLIMG